MRLILHIGLPLILILSVGMVKGQSESDLLSEEFLQLTNPFEFNVQPNYTYAQGKKYNQSGDLNHPDFGKMTFASPFQKNVVEVISKRKIDERYYIDLNDPTFFYIEKSSQPINFYQDDKLIAIDPSLHLVTSGVYNSGAQPAPTSLDLNSKKSSIKIGNNYFDFNNYTLKTIGFDNSETFHAADWSTIQVGNFGALITDIFPGIDMKIIYRQAGFKTEFIVKQNLNVKKLIFIDALSLPSNHYLTLEEETQTSRFFVQVKNAITNDTEILIDPARTYDASGNKQSYISPYQLNGNTVEIHCDSAIINKAGIVYPLTIDPLIIAVGPSTSVFGIRGSLLSPASCNHTITVSYPPGSTPWDVSASWSVYTDFCYRTLALFGFFDDCYMSDARVWLTSTCGGASPVGAPGITWTCFPGCNAIGTWAPTLPFASSGTQSLAQCYPASCAAVNRAFTINDNRGYCSTFGAYDNCTWANSYCVSLDQWSITVQGRTMETLGNTVTGNGSQTINDPTCAGTSILNPGALYGVAPYTYNWSTGATTPTISVTNTPAVITCLVTDACGNPRTATFNIGCPLPVRLIEFNAQKVNGWVELNWLTKSEEDLKHFELQRADESFNFSTLFTVAAQGQQEANNNYEFVDKLPIPGQNYYRLKMVDNDGEIEYSGVRTVFMEVENPNLDIVPNPNNGNFALRFLSETKQDVNVTVYSANGQFQMSTTHHVEQGLQEITINKGDLPIGIYFISLETKKDKIISRLVIQ